MHCMIQSIRINIGCTICVDTAQLFAILIINVKRFPLYVYSKLFTPPGASREAPGGWRTPGGKSVCFEHPSSINNSDKQDKTNALENYNEKK